MVILFLTSSLEPGKDGVGDYTRRLAQACLALNHSCGLVALNDPHVSDPVETAEGHLPTLRLPATMPWPDRVGMAKEFRSRFQPDRVSLQFVAYGFDRKGIVRNLDRFLAPITSGIALQIMFHELWIGLGKSASLKERVMGQVQRHYLQRLISRLRPGWVSTSNALYISLLEGLGQAAVELPLFGNIPVNAAGDVPALPEALVRAGMCDEQGAHPGRWLGLFFGTLHPEWKPEPFMSSLIAASAKAGRRPCLISAGRSGERGEATWKQMERDYAHDVDFIHLGEQPVRQVSALMLAADFGVAASPWQLIGKSSSAVSMLDHGLPVIVSRDDLQTGVTPAPPVNPLLHRCDATLESQWVAGLPKRPARDRLHDVAREFVRLLTSSPRQGPLE